MARLWGIFWKNLRFVSPFIKTQKIFFTFLHTHRWLCKWSLQRCNRIIFRLSLWAMTGRSPKGITAQGTTLGGQWTKYFALWKSSRSQLTDNFPIPFALSERKIAIPFLPRALPWAVFLLGFQPVFARNHDCCTILCAIFLLGFYSAISCDLDVYTILCAIFLLGFQPVIAARWMV